jgi:tetratricopeptide (TPR) repeat protein
MQFMLVMKVSTISSSICCIAALLLSGTKAYPRENPADVDNRVSPAIPGCTSTQSSAYQEVARVTLPPEGSENLDQRLHRLESGATSLGNCRLRAKVYVQIGLLEMRMSRFAEAQKAAEEALAIHRRVATLTSLELGVGQFVRASGLAVTGDYPAAEQAFKNAAQFLANCGPGAHRLQTRVYSELALVYVQEHELKLAEEAIDKSIASEQKEGKPDAVQEVLVKDSLAHILFARGRVSEATATTRQLMDKYGASTKVTTDLRAHLYEDYASLCMQEKKLSEAVDYFKVSVGLQEETVVRGNQARTLALLGRAQMLESHLDDAEQSLTKAVKQAPVLDENPIDKALVFETYGELLIAKRRWDDARSALKNALSNGSSGAAFANVHIAAWTHLAEADHHLHLKKEEKGSRKEAKRLLAAYQYPGSKDVVDIAALKDSYVPNGH